MLHTVRSVVVGPGGAASVTARLMRIEVRNGFERGGPPAISLYYEEQLDTHPFRASQVVAGKATAQGAHMWAWNQWAVYD